MFFKNINHLFTENKKYTLDLKIITNCYLLNSLTRRQNKKRQFIVLDGKYYLPGLYNCHIQSIELNAYLVFKNDADIHQEDEQSVS